MNPRYLPINLDMDKPVDAGAALAGQAFVPILASVEVRLGTPEARIKFWAGVLSCITGSMAASIGADATEELFQQMAPLARQAEAAMASPGSQERH